MRTPLLAAAVLFILLSCARAQFGSFTDAPVDVRSDETSVESGVAIARGNVIIAYGETTIYCDYAQYNANTREVLVLGNVRIYREGQVFVGERAVYNLETKALRTADFRGSSVPYLFSAGNLDTTVGREIRVRNAGFTTSDSSTPDYYLRAKRVRLYPKDRVIFTGVTLYVGKTPIFWWPYLYQSLQRENAFSLSPGYSNTWGPFLLSKYHFPISENISGELRLDLYGERGVGIGLGADFKYRRGSKDSWGTFRPYFIEDSSPGTNKTAFRREPISPGRYRIAFQSRIYLTDELYSTININKLSDQRFLQDFEPSLFRIDPQPDTMIALTKWDENYAITLLTRPQINQFFTTTERLPEGSFDFKRGPLFHSPVFYESETSAGNLRRSTSDLSDLPGYDAVRLDTFHQFLYPRTYFGWLSIVPRVGLRGSWYSDSGRSVTNDFTTTVAGVTTSQTVTAIDRSGAIFRGVVNGGFESSFKLWKEYEGVQSRVWGLDGLRHIVQPYTDLSFAYTSKNPDEILQFDRILPSTQLAPIDFPQFNTIDSISNWTIWRFGLRNRLQTRRDNETFGWLDLDTYFDVYLDNPDFPGITTDNGSVSNIFNRLTWQPLPWMIFTIDSQLPLLNNGFTEVNTGLTFMANRDLKLNLSHRYINGNPFFQNSSLLSFGGYYRISDNWGFSFAERYEFDDSTLESQTYQLHRDLSSWVASLGVVIRDNSGVNEYGILLSFTLKDLPNVTLPLALDPQSQGLPGSN